MFALPRASCAARILLVDFIRFLFWCLMVFPYFVSSFWSNGLCLRFLSAFLLDFIMFFLFYFLRLHLFSCFCLSICGLSSSPVSILVDFIYFFQWFVFWCFTCFVFFFWSYYLCFRALNASAEACYDAWDVDFHVNISSFLCDAPWGLSRRNIWAFVIYVHPRVIVWGHKASGKCLGPLWHPQAAGGQGGPLNAGSAGARRPPPRLCPSSQQINC